MLGADCSCARRQRPQTTRSPRRGTQTRSAVIQRRLNSWPTPGHVLTASVRPSVRPSGWARRAAQNAQEEKPSHPSAVLEAALLGAELCPFVAFRHATRSPKRRGSLIRQQGSLIRQQLV